VTGTIVVAIAITAIATHHDRHHHRHPGVRRHDGFQVGGFTAA
jgi:hypothetical protein